MVTMPGLRPHRTVKPIRTGKDCWILACLSDVPIQLAEYPA